jgi:pimeloyl-ACP methyl ester carboxylesterase
VDEKRYRAAEQRLFAAAGVEPAEEWVELQRVGARARVLATGEGPPVVFFSGGPNAAATWAYVAANLAGVRCLLVDRPGTGLSGPPARIPDRTNLASYVVDLGLDVLDGLALDRTAVVGSSFGGYLSIRLAATHPDRLSHLVLAACPAFVPGWTGPQIATLLRTPVLGRVMMRIPPSRAGVRMSLRQFGHSRSLLEGRISRPMLDWILSWQRDTDTMKHDGEMIIGCGTWRGGFDAALDLTPAELASVSVPTTILIGAADTVGGEAVGQRLAAAIPRASLQVLDDAGHLPWLDDPVWLAAGVRTAVLGPQSV